MTHLLNPHRFATAAPPSAAQKFAGHIPNRVLMGMACAAGAPGPSFSEAISIIGAPVYENRRFVGNWISQSNFNGMLDNANAHPGVLPFISFKVPGSSRPPDWQRISDGLENTQLNNLANYVRAYGQPIVVTFEHEPQFGGWTPADAAAWGRMQEYCAWYFGGRRGGTAASTYDPANDLTINNGGNMAWATVGNGGAWWINNATNQQNIRNAAYPPATINALNVNKGILCNDFYDVEYIDVEASFTQRSARIPDPSRVPTSEKIGNFLTWARANGVNASGCGEFGVITGAEMTTTWQLMRDNRDIWCLANYFNSMANSDHEWRLIPSTYPDTNYVSSRTNNAGEGFQDLGGDAQSQGRLDAYRIALAESISAQYTSPL